MVFFEAIFFGLWAVGIVFAACELGQRFSNAFEEVDDVVSQMDWYLLPIKIKRMLITVMIHSQRPCAVEFFGSISCSREQFKSVSLTKKIARKLNYWYV